MTESCLQKFFLYILFSIYFFAEPSTEIIGAPDLYIESGSTINLTCVILNSPEPPAYIFWNHNNAVSVIFIFIFFRSFGQAITKRYHYDVTYK